jgi:TonB-dependent SusC/RagA subfamily outer membrane receptor
MRLSHIARSTRSVSAIALVAIGANCSSNPKPAPEVVVDPHVSSRSDATIQPGKEGRQYSSMADYIQGHAPGVQVIQGGEGAFSLRIRGMSSPNGINDPLIVIDGNASGLPGTRALDGLNPNDIVKIEVLKDAASTAMYGLRGGSGVILVTTRKR